jgi:hypothetical protein
MVATTQKPRDHDRSNIRDNACLTTPVQLNWNVLEHHHAKITSFIVCAVKHPPIIEVNVYEEIEGTYRRPVSFASKIHGPMRWSPVIPAHTLTATCIVLTDVVQSELLTASLIKLQINLFKIVTMSARLQVLTTDEEGCLLGCCAVLSVRSLPTFQRYLLPPSAGRRWRQQVSLKRR